MNTDKEKSRIHPLIAWPVILAVLGALAWVLMVPSGHGPISFNEITAVTRLRGLGTAQGNFKRNDYYGMGKETYARHARHLFEFRTSGGETQRPHLIDKGLHDAFGKGVPVAAYLYRDIAPTASLDPLTADDEPIKGYAYCAYPAEYDRTGRQTFVMDLGGTVYGRDMGGKPVDTFPEDLEGWVAAGS